jgi:hypothetical protein
MGEKLSVYKQFVDGFWLVEGRVDGDVRVQLKVKLNEIQL